MDEISSFVKKIRSVFIIKKMILICQNIRSGLWDVKKKGFVMTKIQICFVIYIKKKEEVIFDDKNSDLFYYIFSKKKF